MHCNGFLVSIGYRIGTANEQLNSGLLKKHFSTTRNKNPEFFASKTVSSSNDPLQNPLKITDLLYA